MVGERGLHALGGAAPAHRHRPGPARSIPPILILDDATSAIDVKVEQQIHSGLRVLMEGRTTLIVAHRLSTISLADRVVLLDGGRIVADGTHAELLASTPLYSEVLAQAAQDDERGGRATVDRSHRRRARSATDGFDGSAVRRWAAGGASGAAQPGLPFGGIPHELQAGVDLLLAEEPDRGESDITFSQQPSADEKARLSLSGLLMVYPGMLAAGPRAGGHHRRGHPARSHSSPGSPSTTGCSPGHHDFGLVVLLARRSTWLSVAISAAAQWGQVRVTGRLASWVMNDLRVTIFRHLQRLSLDFFTEEKAGVVMSRMTSDIENLQQLLQDGLAQFAMQGLTMVVIAVFLFTTNVRLAIITIVVVIPPLIVMSIWFKRASERGYDKVRDGIALVLADLSESLQGVRIVTAHNRQRYNVVNHRNVVGSYRDANYYTGRINGIYGPGSQLLGVIGQVVILAVGGDMVPPPPAPDRRAGRPSSST